MNDRDLGWLAGIVDGEGCLTIDLKSEATGARYLPAVQIKMTSRAAIARVHELRPGKLREQAASGMRRRAYIWRLRGRAALDFVRLLRPALVVKAAVADVFLDYEQTYCAMRPEMRRDLREQLYHEVQRLNNGPKYRKRAQAA